ncbi:hypothetical protein [Martelella alba]|uniref:Cell surface protein n=1 Tax=Martelella alba TaxID=2590451 RepID=A0ABY2SMC7_9HYPH|nr:hypothetical protein [Martelella alba]TKI06087.1 hypothetical protein FCN80_11225 [Martelella alba]
MALAPPILPQANNGNISLPVIQNGGGLYFQIPRYANVAVDDRIRVFWNSVQVWEYIISSQQQFFPISGQIPTVYISLGISNIYYTVTDRAFNTSLSEIVNVNIVAGLSLLLTTGAVNQDFDAIKVYPFNRGVVYGEPGKLIELNVLGNARFDVNNSQFYSARLDNFGQADFRLFSFSQGNNQVTAFDPGSGAFFSGSTVFGPFTVGSDRIIRVNHSNGAPANGRTFNSLYLMTERTSNRSNPITMVRAQVSGSAQIVGVGQVGNILLNSDQSATIDIFDRVAERVNVTLTLPEASGSVVMREMVFVPEP